MSKKFIGLTLLLLVVVAIVRVALKGFYIPLFCSPYYTQTYLYLEQLPSSENFSKFLQNEGWETSTQRGYDSAQGNLILQANKRPFVFLSRPNISVKMFSTFENPEKGMISFFISENTGNRIANKIVFGDFVTKTNSELHLNLDVNRYNYINNCN